MRTGEEQNDNPDRWLLTYADMITLLMAFFIMMYSMSVLNVSKFRQAAISIRSGFGGLVRGQGRSVLGSSGTFGPRPSAIEGDTAGVPWRVLRPLVTYIENTAHTGTKEGGPAEIGEDLRGIVITLRSDSLLFDSGRATIKRQARPMLTRIAQTLAKIDNMVQIEGHTCDLQPRGGRYPTNWELSTARATNVLRAVAREGLDAWRFSAAGYGSVRPVAPNDSEANRKKNRRVEIVILRPETPVGTADREKPRRISDPHQVVFRRRLN